MFQNLRHPKRRHVAALHIFLCGMLLPLATQARPPMPLLGIPSTNEVVKYSCYNDVAEGWLEIPKSEGDTILTCLRDYENFTDWASTLPPGIVVKMAPDPWHFHIVATNGFYAITFSEGARTVSIPGKRRLVVPDEQRNILSQLFNTWREADFKKITSQPLPCQFLVGSLRGSHTLSGIARLFYGDATKWPLIWEANKTTIPNPDIIRHGQIITIPKQETP